MLAYENENIDGLLSYLYIIPVSTAKMMNPSLTLIALNSVLMRVEDVATDFTVHCHIRHPLTLLALPCTPALLTRNDIMVGCVHG